MKSMFWIKGSNLNYDGWQLPGRGWNDVAPVFTRIAEHRDGHERCAEHCHARSVMWPTRWAKPAGSAWTETVTALTYGLLYRCTRTNVWMWLPNCIAAQPFRYAVFSP